MGTMLNPVRDDLRRVSRLTESGRYAEAKYILLELSLNAAEPSAEQFAVRMAWAKAAVEAQRYGEAKVQLRMASRLQPLDPEVLFLWGRLYESDPHGCDRRAARKYKKATILNASEPKYRAALGRALVRISNVRSGVKVLRRAAEAAPADPDVLEIVREGLQEAEQTELALQILNKAMFLAPTDCRVKHLWNQARFAATAELQKQNRQSVRGERGDHPVVIPFVRIHHAATNEAQPDATILRVRRDVGEVAQPRPAALKAYRK